MSEETKLQGVHWEIFLKSKSIETDAKFGLITDIIYRRQYWYLV